MATLQDLAERLDRLLLRHQELERTNALLQAQLGHISSERDSLNCATGSTMRGSGVHHSTGCPWLYQGNTPRR